MTESAPVMVEQGADFRVVEWVTATTEESGEKLSITNRYTEVATGLHYRDEQGQWQETVAEFVAVPDGFVAARGPHQVALSTELTVPGAVTVVTADGQTLRSSPALLALTDRVSGESVLLAEVQPSRAEQIGPGTVLYANVLDSVPADLRTVYTAAGFECDLILREPLPDPGQYGLNPDTTDVEVYTEFFGSRPTAVEVREVPVGERESAADAQLTFGPMVMDRGRAFILPGERDSREVPVRKSWEQREGREFLIERTAYRDLEPLLRELPEASAPTSPIRQRSRNVQRTAQLSIPSRVGVTPSWRRTEAGRLVAMNATSSPRAGVAKNQSSVPGVVLDYTLVNSSTNQTFGSLTTYYVSGLVNLSTSVTFQAGTVIKYAKTNSPSLKVLAGTAITWLGAPYRPVVLTGYDDNSVGEMLAGSTGSPSGTYANRALEFDGTGRTSPLILTNLSIRHATLGLAGSYFSAGTAPLIVRHAQFVHCDAAVQFQQAITGQEAYFLQNALVFSTNTGSYAFRNTSAAKVAGEFLTVNAADVLFHRIDTYSTLAITNSLLFDVGNTNGVSLANSGVPSANPFVTAGSGAHYLNLLNPTVRGWLDARPTSLQPPSTALASELAKSTVMAPVSLPSTVSFDLTLSGGPDPTLTSPELRVGFHYWPIHFLSTGLSVSGATVSLTNGVVVAGMGTNAFFLGSGGKLSSVGRPDQLNRLVWASSVQEGTGAASVSRTLIGLAIGTSTFPEVRCRFTEFSLTADPNGRRNVVNLDYTANKYVGMISFRDCQIRAGVVNFTPVTSGGGSQSLELVNNVWLDSTVGAYRNVGGSQNVTLRHNLLVGSALTLYYYFWDATGNPQWICTDNVFQSTSITAPNISTNRLYAGWNGYSASTATLGGTSNKVSLAGDWVTTGPLGPWCYPTTTTVPSLGTLRNNGSRSATAADLYHYTTRVDQMKDGLDDATRVDIGFHYPAVTGSAWADSDQDGLPDVVEDSDGDGVVDAGETNWTNADTDGDGALDGEEVAGSTNPKDKTSWIPKRLAAWWWEGTSGTWRLGDRGQTPLGTGAETQTPNGAVGSGVDITLPSSGPLRYDVNDPSGRPNLRLDQGGIRLWLKPNWTLPNPPAWSAPLIEVGKYNNSILGWWSWYLLFDGNGDFWLNLGQGAGSVYLNRFITKLSPASWAAASWHELVMSYNGDATRVFHNNALNVWVDSAGNQWDHGLGIDLSLMPTSAGRGHGIHVGSDHTGTLPVKGVIDSVETFNYPIGGVETLRHQQLTLNVVTNAGIRQLQFQRNFQGARIPSGIGYPGLPDPKGMTVWRRTSGTTNWGTELVVDWENETWTDAGITPGSRYEYMVKVSDYLRTSYRHFIAGIEMPAQHQRGHVLLIVANDLASSLGADLALLKTNLVGDGWTVASWYGAPVHNDLTWGNNSNNIALVTNWIYNNYNPAVSNVIFIIGHVTIPYSGGAAADGHADHVGAWVCDAYYGFLDKTKFSDTNSAPGHVSGDFKFDQDYLPGLPDFPVGRVDFRRMPVFSGLSESQLVQRYLAKDFKYRTNGIPTFVRVSVYENNGSGWGIPSGQGLAGASFGVAPGTVFQGANLRERVPADLGVHFSYATTPDIGVLDDRGISFDSSAFANSALEVPVTFRHVWFSYASDWDRLDPLSRNIIENNWLKASLGWPNHGLATVGGPIWDFSPLGGGGVLANLMQLGWEGNLSIPRFQSILGDPTLRLFRLSPPGQLSVSRIGSVSTLSWLPSSEVGCKYYIYRSNSGIAGPFVLLNSGLAVGGLTFSDPGSSSGITYQVRSARLQITGSGSFENLSQGVFVETQ
ncbi:MAG: hypothetical protein J0M24_18760 [Verrucomicrobia bacterium]|nr:hypothetical protein [Verrucomicrobiota bacterium]